MFNQYSVASRVKLRKRAAKRSADSLEDSPPAKKSKTSSLSKSVSFESDESLAKLVDRVPSTTRLDPPLKVAEFSARVNQFYKAHKNKVMDKKAELFASNDNPAPNTLDAHQLLASAMRDLVASIPPEKLTREFAASFLRNIAETIYNNPEYLNCSKMYNATLCFNQVHPTAFGQELGYLRSAAVNLLEDANLNVSELLVYVMERHISAVEVIFTQNARLILLELIYKIGMMLAFIDDEKPLVVIDPEDTSNPYANLFISTAEKLGHPHAIIWMAWERERDPQEKRASRNSRQILQLLDAYVTITDRNEENRNLLADEIQLLSDALNELPYAIDSFYQPIKIFDALINLVDKGFHFEKVNAEVMETIINSISKDAQNGENQDKVESLFEFFVEFSRKDNTPALNNETNLLMLELIEQFSSQLRIELIEDMRKLPFNRQSFYPK